MRILLTDDYEPLKGKMLQVLDRGGKVVVPELEPVIDPEILKRAYRTMVLSRQVDEKAIILQRQGRLGAYPPNRGQEAAQLGPAMTLAKDDWLVWAFRELAALMWKGVPLINYYLYWMGNEEGNHFPPGTNVTPSCIPVGSQLPYATGIAYASQYRQERAVTLAFCGDGATSEGDFHEALNFACVYKLPCVFVVQNNQWAISVPRSRQTASATLAQKAIAYGMPGILVDGNDVLAMYIASLEAAERARRGEGPTLIEAYTYRLGDHTTSDDAKRYREEQDLREWEKKDPLIRFKAYIVDKGLLTEEDDKKLVEELKALTEKTVLEAEGYPEPTIDQLFQYTYSQMGRELGEELERLKKELSGGDR
jgi:pyruvate dehydrogenase E1 component alpha subunit